jgi:hypothetical protein
MRPEGTCWELHLLMLLLFLMRSSIAHRAPLIAGGWAAAAAAAWAAEDDCEAVAHIAHDLEGQAHHVPEATHCR